MPNDKYGKLTFDIDNVAIIHSCVNYYSLETKLEKHYLIINFILQSFGIEKVTWKKDMISV